MTASIIRTTSTPTKNGTKTMKPTAKQFLDIVGEVAPFVRAQGLASLCYDAADIVAPCQEEGWTRFEGYTARQVVDYLRRGWDGPPPVTLEEWREAVAQAYRGR